MNRADLWRAIAASDARMHALMDELVALHDRMPDKGVDSPMEERVLIAAIDAESDETRRLAALLHAHGRRRLWLGVIGWSFGVATTFAVVFVLLR